MLLHQSKKLMYGLNATDMDSENSLIISRMMEVCVCLLMT